MQVLWNEARFPKTISYQFNSTYSILVKSLQISYTTLAMQYIFVVC
jgi:hypothetical protein